MPPVKGISKYATALLDGFSSDVEIDVIAFNHMYPERLYPGGTKDESLRAYDARDNVRIDAKLNWYNPIGWIVAGFSLRGSVVHAQWWSYVLAPVYITILGIARYLRHKQVVLTVHNVRPHESGGMQEFANRSVFRLAHHYIVHSDENKKVFAESYGIEPANITVIPHGILLPEGGLRNVSKSDARQKLGIKPGAKVVLFFGIIREYKGLDDLLESFAAVSRDYPEAQLVVAGKPWDEWATYQQIIDKHQMGDKILLNLSFIKEGDIEDYYRAADVVVLPYKHFDSQSGAAALALPFHKAVIVTKVGGLPDIVLNDEALVNPGSTQELTQAISRVFADTSLQAKLEKSSEKLARELDWGTIAHKTLALYNKLERTSSQR